MNKIKLYFGMQLAANTAALAIFIVICLFPIIFDYISPVTVYFLGLAGFLIYRVCAFMANRQLELNDVNVEFMSVERTKWNLATIAVALPLIPLKMAILWLLNALM